VAFTQHNTMSLIKNCVVVTSNGHVVGMHPNQEDAEQQAYELALEWRRQADCGAEVPAPRLAVLDFNSWMQLQEEFVF
jgi:hypothetical protein